MSVSVIAAAAAASIWSLPAPSSRVEGTAEHISSWLVSTTIPNTDVSTMDAHPFDIRSAQPGPGSTLGGLQWFAFDDRCFSRNYDDYVDLFSYLRIVRGEQAAGVAVYAAIWVWSPKDQQAQLRVGADSMFRAWWNGREAGRCDVGNPHRVTEPLPPPKGFPNSWYRVQRDNAGKDMSILPIDIRSGWNLLLLKVANRTEGLFGFYCRISDAHGDRVPGLVLALAPETAQLQVIPPSMPGCKAQLPTAFREWPYCAADHPLITEYVAERPQSRQQWSTALQAAPFRLSAGGGQPPYRWSITRGRLPDGLRLSKDGVLQGTVSARAALGDRQITFRVTDTSGHSAERTITLTTRERPNRWYERARLHGLIHGPERFAPEDWPKLAQLMKRQGYTTGIPISYGNGDWIFRWSSRFEPDAEHRETIGRVKQALEDAGLKFGMYFGNTFDAPQYRYEQVILMLEDACRQFRPAAIWFDWLAIEHSSLDAIYSMIRTLLPDTVIVVNGFDKPSHGDWDACSVEEFTFDPDKRWGRWPGEQDPLLQRILDTWPKRHTLESWRVMLWPYQGRVDVVPDWQDYLRITLSLIGEGYIPNLDHSPLTGAFPNTERVEFTTFDRSVLLKAHAAMADWANPAGQPSLVAAYTDVDPAAVEPAEWGYALESASDPKQLYLLAMSNPRGKTGLPSTELRIQPIRQAPLSVVCMNTNLPVPFRMEGATLVVSTRGLQPDPVATVFRVALRTPLPKAVRPTPPMEFPGRVVAPGDLAHRKPARLLSLDGTRELVPSGETAVAANAVDGYSTTFAQGAYEWAWTLEVDLEQIVELSRIRFLFGAGWATAYDLQISTDGTVWRPIATGAGEANAWREHRFHRQPARYIRLRGIKPDGENQPGVQMSVAELQAFR